MESKLVKLKTFTFTKADRLRKKEDFAFLKTDSTKFRSDGLIIFFKQHPQLTRKVGISVSAKVGNAVVRNKMKRALREYFRLNKAKFLNYHYLFVVTKPDKELVLSSLQYFIEKLKG